MRKNLIARIIVAAIFIPLILYVSLQGGVWLFSLLAVFMVLGIGEFLIAEGYKLTSLVFWITTITTALVFTVTSGFYPVVENGTSSITLGALLLFFYFILYGMIATLQRKEPAKLFTNYTRIMWGMVYVGVLYATVFRLGDERESIDGGKMLVFLFAILWAGDTAAMWVGSQWGKHKLAPTVSPNKTVEGFFGGVAAALVVAVAVFFLGLFESISLWHLLGIAFGASIFGQLGDMVESLWKRSLNIKDSSHLIPGHGGILDRFDSLLFAAPFVYTYLLLILE